jgi:predicted Fe-S protein YdhL (DUF1289 family)
MATIVTPCINVCVLDPETGLCRGCARTVDEIASWATMSEADRKKIMLELPQRQRARNNPAASVAR